MTWRTSLLLGLILAATTLPAFADAPGQRLFQACAACHSLEQGRNGIGPSLFQVVGQPAGQAKGFRYSNVLRRTKLEWNRDNLEKFLRNPQALLPGNRMAFSGIENEADIKNLINYLDKAEKH